jgi:plastocyanin
MAPNFVRRPPSAGEAPTVRRYGATTLMTALILAGLMLTILVDARPSHAMSAVVDIKDLAYSPPTIQITQGDTVTWTNDEDVMPHDVTSGAFGQPDLGQLFGSQVLMPGQSFAATFDEPGEFVYVCKLHPTMTGVVIVLPS